MLDSTTITLHDTLSDLWQGCGGSNRGTAAALKIQVLWNFTIGVLRHLSLRAGRVNDRQMTVQNLMLPPGALRLADPGYFAIPHIATAQGSYVLSRWYSQTALFAADGTPLDLLTVLHTEAHHTLDWDILLGRRERVPLRLLAMRLPQE